MARKDDRRIQKTRKALRDALHSLVLDRGYDDLSVQDITDKANLGVPLSIYTSAKKMSCLRTSCGNSHRTLLSDMAARSVFPIVKSCSRCLSTRKITMTFTEL